MVLWLDRTLQRRCVSCCQQLEIEAFKLDFGLIKRNHPTLWKEYVDWLQTGQFRNQQKPVICEGKEEEGFPLPGL